MRNTLLLSLFFLFILSGCSKEGPNGLDGTNGINGVNGIDGADGSTIFSGNGVPETSIGKQGDYYLNLTSYQLFGPKRNNSWGIGTDLKGQDGAEGKAGTSILSGNGNPSSSLGKNGDLYFDGQSFLLYGPKASNSWGGGLLLKGNDGNANVKTYVYNNAYTSLNPLNGTNMFTFSLFPPIKHSDVNTGLILIYVQAKFFDRNGSEDTSQGISHMWSLLGSGSKLMSVYDLNLKYSIPSILSNPPFFLVEGTVLGNYSLNSAADVKYYSGISGFKIVVIPSTTVNHLSIEHGIDKSDIKAISEFIQD